MKTIITQESDVVYEEILFEIIDTFDKVDSVLWACGLWSQSKRWDVKDIVKQMANEP